VLQNICTLFYESLAPTLGVSCCGIFSVFAIIVLVGFFPCGARTTFLSLPCFFSRADQCWGSLELQFSLCKDPDRARRPRQVLLRKVPLASYARFFFSCRSYVVCYLLLLATCDSGHCLTSTVPAFYSGVWGALVMYVLTLSASIYFYWDSTRFI
jgi:hypothetical protein